MTTTIDAMTAFIVALLALSVVMHALGEWSRRKARAEYESWRRAVAEYKAWQSAADVDARVTAAMATLAPEFSPFDADDYPDD